VILALLGERPMHGYEIGLELVARDVKDWAGVSRAQVYYSLRKLHGAGLIRDVESGDSAGPERTVYRITIDGLRSMEKALDDDRWAKQRPPNPFVTWLALSVHLPRAIFRRIALERTRYVQVQLKKEQTTLAALANAPPSPAVTLGRRMVELGVSQFEAELDWLRKLTRELGG
jgi:DNA-binding PadR family transcriptional regulator